MKAKAGHHKHKCPKCSKVWQHEDSMAGNEDAHKCPKCSTVQWTKHYTPKERAAKEQEVGKEFADLFGFLFGRAA